MLLAMLALKKALLAVAYFLFKTKIIFAAVIESLLWSFPVALLSALALSTISNSIFTHKCKNIEFC